MGLAGPCPGDFGSSRIAGVITVPLLISLSRIPYQQKDQRSVLGYLAHARDEDPKNTAGSLLLWYGLRRNGSAIQADKSLLEPVKVDGNNLYYNYVLGAVWVPNMGLCHSLLRQVHRAEAVSARTISPLPRRSSSGRLRPTRKTRRRTRTWGRSTFSS